MNTTTEELEFTNITRIAGQDEDYACDVILRSDSKRALCVDVPSVVTSKEQQNPTFLAYAGDVQIGNNKSMISLVNASGSTVKVKIREIKIISAQTTAVTGLISTMTLLRCTNHSAGTSLTPQAYDTTDTLSGSVTARTGATISGELAPVIRKWNWSTDEYGVGAQDIESMDHALAELLPGWGYPFGTKPFTLNANEGLTLKQIVNSTVGTFNISIIFTVET